VKNKNKRELKKGEKKAQLLSLVIGDIAQQEVY